ncbi:hypothetical protein CPY51_08670 [Rhizobium tubonense]|uniref:Uncharacterized protein n=1 Tax=Rhizobium tubonense TaxID=484088 RepID=A0A2W4ENA3_9HYPH|nr:hypothetical protein CPY51_08670 [Rhizobium tubonense]
MWDMVRERMLRDQAHHQRADDAASPFRRGKGRGQRNENLGHTVNNARSRLAATRMAMFGAAALRVPGSAANAVNWARANRRMRSSSGAA